MPSDLADTAAQSFITRWRGTTASELSTAQVPQWRYLGARQALWPQADFVVGNPPFIGNKRMREALGDGYALALRAAWPEMPESADFVMFWWARAAALVAAGQVQRMGLITTNSLTMIFNRRVVQSALDGNGGLAAFKTDGGTAGGGAGAGIAGGLILSKAQKSAPGNTHPSADAPVNAPAVKPARCELVFAIPDHPWVDSADGAAVRIAMTVIQRAAVAEMGSDPNFAQQNLGSDPISAGSCVGRLLSVTDEQPGPEGEVLVTLTERRGRIHADLSVGADVQSAKALVANDKLANRGVIPHGPGFVLTEDEAIALGLGTVPGLDQHLRPYRNGKDLTDHPRFARVIDLHGLSADAVRQRFPHVYQWLLERVKPEREQNNRARVRDLWWLFAEARVVMRASLRSLSRYIATGQVAKHRVFQFLETSILPDDKLIAIALDDAFHLGVLSSNVHVTWALALGGRLGVGNDPVYSKSTCFDTFPFPAEDTGLTPTVRQKISQLAKQIDQHRKRVLGLLPPDASSPTPLATSVRGLPGADFWAFNSMRPPANPEPARAEPEILAFEASNQPLANVKQAQTAINTEAQVNPPGAPAVVTSAATEPAKWGSEPEFCYAKSGSDPHLATPATAPALARGILKPAKDLTLTGLYNVLQALRDGRPLTAKEKQIHSAGLVGVLKTLHDELYTAVLAAYGWSDLAQSAPSGDAALTAPAHSATPPTSLATSADTKDELLQRLVALNQHRAVEEANGQVRWLRPAFQNPLAKTELPVQVQQALEVDLASSQATPVVTTQTWPSTLPEQVKAVAQVLSQSPAALTLAQIAASFGGSANLKKLLPTLLQTLEALGRAQRVTSSDVALWRA